MKPAAASLRSARQKLLAATLDLEIFVTNRCNLNCDYCVAREASAGIRKKALSRRELFRAIDLYVAARAAGIKKHGVRAPHPNCITFVGGEPFMEFGLLVDALKYIKKQDEKYIPCIMTNGTLLSREKAGKLLDIDENLALCVSLDGNKAVTDSKRRMRGGGKTSVFDTVIGNLRKLPQEYIDRIQAVVTLTPQTAASAADSVDALVKTGFNKVRIHFDTEVLWSPEELENLRGALRKLRAYYLDHVLLALPGGKQEVFGLFFEKEFQEEQRDDFHAQVSISLDGVFFPCDVAYAAGGRISNCTVGSLKAGIDVGKIEKFSLDLLAGIWKKHPESAFSLFQTGLYTRAKGEDVLANLANIRRMGAIFEEELGGLLEVQKICRETNDDSSFGDFVHEPKFRGTKETGSCRLCVRGKTLGACRDELDFFLYAPGGAKALLIEEGDEAFEGATALVFYALAKARHLKKKITIGYRTTAGETGKNRLAFFRENGVVLVK